MNLDNNHSNQQIPTELRLGEDVERKPASKSAKALAALIALSIAGIAPAASAASSPKDGKKPALECPDKCVPADTCVTKPPDKKKRTRKKRKKPTPSREACACPKGDQTIIFKPETEIIVHCKGDEQNKKAEEKSSEPAEAPLPTPNTPQSQPEETQGDAPAAPQDSGEENPLRPSYEGTHFRAGIRGVQHLPYINRPQLTRPEVFLAARHVFPDSHVGLEGEVALGGLLTKPNVSAVSGAAKLRLLAVVEGFEAGIGGRVGFHGPYEKGERNLFEAGVFFDAGIRLSVEDVRMLIKFVLDKPAYSALRSMEHSFGLGGEVSIEY